MKLLTNLTFLILLATTTFAQVKGNKQIETKTFAFEQIESVKINFYAEVTIDYTASEGMTITTDANLFDLIKKEMNGTELVLDQKEWIAPSKKAVIVIGAPNLKKVTTGTHDITRVINLDSDYFQLLSPIGDVTLSGRTKELRLGIELAQVNAGNLVAENARVNIWSRGSAKVNVENELFTKLDEDAKLTVVNQPKSLKGDAAKAVAETDSSAEGPITWIDFTIKNNSGKRQQLFVNGPKPDGSYFGYGFPMNPLTTRDKHWTVGSKVYKVSKTGLRKLLLTITAEDEGQTVNLFD